MFLFFLTFVYADRGESLYIRSQHHDGRIPSHAGIITTSSFLTTHPSSPKVINVDPD